MSPTVEEVQRSADAQRELALTLFRAVPESDWVTVVATFVEGGATNIGHAKFIRPDSSFGSIRGGWAVFEAWTAVRASMVDGTKGTWLSAEITLEAAGKYHFDFNYDVRPYGGRSAGLFAPLDDPSTAMPTDDDWREDLRRYPRSPEFLPNWLAALAGEGDAPVVAPHEALDSSLIIAALAAPITWPEELAMLESSPEWTELYDAVSASTAVQLDVNRDITSMLASESKRAEWGGWLDSLLQAVFSDVFANRIESGDVAGLERVWRPLEAAGLAKAPTGLENIDRSAPVTGIGGNMPDVVVRLIDDVSHALGVLIAGQLINRFGFAPEA
ncbi:MULTISPECIES: hypothetical protein [unclassified Frondihabitans]|uniref:hypothetical protein n=1 Tax=unclassified Frondihabitans TaxID=2626248 RepID=UPI000F4DDF00|nr:MULTISPECIES: hypothetical protein [unclassified Frondihabitans]RPE76047.1 hypothetical protein EDF37_1865 [Frondihabitans sp. PhB153]RPF05676.1 hypothetical protein EDF39_2383 [Frondihabitans sp. PhB161]